MRFDEDGSAATMAFSKSMGNISIIYFENDPLSYHYASKINHNHLWGNLKYAGPRFLDAPMALIDTGFNDGCFIARHTCRVHHRLFILVKHKYRNGFRWLLSR